MTQDATAENLPDPNALAPQAEPQAPPVAPAQDPADNQDQTPQHGNKGRQPWYMDRIAQNQRKADEANAAAADARQRAQAAEEMLARMQAGQTPPNQQQPQQRQVAPEEFRAAVTQEAQAQRFMEDVQRVKSAGFADFPNDFAATIEAAGGVGLGRPDVLADLFAVDPVNAHHILHDLTQESNLERAAALADMDPRRRIAEFTRMADAVKGKTVAAAPSAPAAPTTKVSKAPAPAPTLVPSASKTVDGYSDEATDDQFTEQFNRRMKERAASRR